MKLSIKRATSSDLPEENYYLDFNSEYGYESDDELDIIFQLTLEIGPSQSGDSDQFQCMVVTPINVDKVPEWSKFLCFEKYNWRKLRERITGIINECERDSWNQCVVELKKYFNWEFE